MKNFSIHWILLSEKKPKSSRIYLPKNSLNALPSVGDELRQSDRDFYKVMKICWCLDESDELGQRVNIGIEKVR